MSILCMTRVWADAPVKGNDLLVMLALADWCNDQGYCWPAYDTLAEKARVSKSTAIRSIKTLEEKGVLRVERNSGRSQQNTYILLLENMAALKGVTLTPPPEKVSNPTEKVSKPPLKGVTGDTQTVRNRQEPCVGDAATHEVEDLFEEFWEAHPKPRDYGKTHDAFIAGVNGGADPAFIIRAVKLYAMEQQGNSAQYVASSHSWLMGARWEDFRAVIEKGAAAAGDPDEAAAKLIASGKSFLCTNITAHRARLLVERGLVTADQCQSAGVRL